ncbi:MAG: hypothetical protein AMK75_06125 [Planctomycetes bacterium SM23_65]|nr:MAG: hypothetical protein AMK75_06125 [Planctomycetes bacterium SM23_65]
MAAFRRDRGTVLVVVLVLGVMMAAFALASLLVSSAATRGAEAAILRGRAFFVASAGFEDQCKGLRDMMSAAALGEPFKTFEALAGQHTIQRRPLMSRGFTVGEYDVVIGSVQAVDVSNRDVSVIVTGAAPAFDHPQAVTRTISAVVRLGVGRSQVFDYVYFINNWGWYYGNTIIANGNVRANGQFDFGGYASTINGLPRFNDSSGGTFDDQVDDGGVYAGWNIVGSSRARGTTSKPEHMHAFGEHLPMPNLTDLTPYEGMARLNESSIKIGNETVCDGVVGDEDGEKSNLYLHGQKNKPIVLDGPVVVRGDLIIKGYVTGKGSFYVQGNIYVAGNVRYKNPIEPLPGKPDKESMTKWLTANRKADALGLFAREHIIVGDYTDKYFQRYVGPWVRDKRNSSEEDAGEDGIPNTRPGRDGILGTADDDILENDGKWTVEHYTAQHARDGLIPEGSHIGEAIPGTGEDIDGDGKYDPGTQMTEFNTKAPLSRQYWGGNFPQGVGHLKYKTICDNNHKINRLDGAFYTNHTFAMLTLDWGHDLNINGCLVSRNEAIVYGTKHAILNYDLRLLEEGFGLQLPRTWKPLQLVMWRSN